MLISESRAITFRGKRATLCVLRNNGYCWGRITCGREQYDVETEDDQYDEDDLDALHAFAKAAADPRNVTRALTRT